MAVTRRYGIYSVGFGSGGGSTLIGGITKQSLSTGSTVKGEPTAGSVYPSFQSMTAQQPGASFDTLHVAAALDACGLQGLSIASLTGGFNLYAQKHAEGGTRAGSGAHRQYVFNEGLVVPRSLSVDHQGDATISYDVIATYDGTNDPVVINDSVSLPTSGSDDERFTLGPVSIESVTIDHLKSLQIEFGIEVNSEGADSEVWPRFASITSVSPKITLRGVDVEWLKSANVPLAGKAATHANTTVFLRKRAIAAHTWPTPRPSTSPSPPPGWPPSMTRSTRRATTQPRRPSSSCCVTTAPTIRW